MCPLVSRLRTRSIIETKWLFKNKLDKVQNSSRLVVHRYNQEEKQHLRYGSLGWTLFGILGNQETTHQVWHTILDLI